MSVFTFFLIALVFFIISFSLVEVRMRYLIKYPQYYDKDYDGHSYFIKVFFSTLRFFIKRINVFFKLLYQSLLHFWVEFVAFINNFLEKIYQRSRDRFMKEVVKDKKAVPHFWKYLKKYKKEKDEESRIDDDSLDVLGK